MNLSEVAMLLGYVGIYDLRVQVDELKVRAWNESLDSDIPFEEAKKIIANHYANFDTAVNPSHINRAWRIRVASERERERGNRISAELEKAKENAVAYEIAEKYLKQIRETLNGVKDASMEKDSGEVASDL